MKFSPSLKLILFCVLVDFKLENCNSDSALVQVGMDQNVEFKEEDERKNSQLRGSVNQLLDHVESFSRAEIEDLYHETDEKDGRRELNTCGELCGANLDCNYGSCNYCNGFTCYNPYKCGRSCSNNNECSFSIDGCFTCLNGICRKMDSNQNNCGQSCTSDSQCSQGPCYKCNISNGMGYGSCGNNSGTNNRNNCGLSCTSNSQCWQGPCFVCNFSGGYGRCELNSGGSNRSSCGIGCSSDNECWQGPCFHCNYSTRRCEYSGGFRTCVSNEAALRSALQYSGSSMVEICANTVITLSQEITSNVHNVILTCQNGSKSCEIRRNTSSSGFRLLTFTGNNVRVTNIIFTGGQATSGNGGALLITGTNSQINNCEFNNNRASQRGGAAAINGGTVLNNSGGGNYAPQCVRIFNAANGFCMNFT